jgi:hypothetical protein
MEAGAQSGWVTRALRQLGYEPIVANPRKLKAISANERKSDRNDALLLAKLATADATLLHPVHHRSEAREVAMSVMHARDALVRERARLISKIRSMCKGVGARLKSGGADAFVHREMDVPVVLQAATGGIFAVIRALNEQITGYDKQFEPMIETSFPEAPRVRQVRGVGPVTALAFVLALEDPSRFRDGRTAAAFLERRAAPTSGLRAARCSRLTSRHTHPVKTRPRFLVRVALRGSGGSPGTATPPDAGCSAGAVVAPQHVIYVRGRPSRRCQGPPSGSVAGLGGRAHRGPAGCRHLPAGPAHRARRGSPDSQSCCARRSRREATKSLR